MSTIKIIGDDGRVSIRNREEMQRVIAQGSDPWVFLREADDLSGAGEVIGKLSSPGVIRAIPSVRVDLGARTFHAPVVYSERETAPGWTTGAWSLDESIGKSGHVHEIVGGLVRGLVAHGYAGNCVRCGIWNGTPAAPDVFRPRFVYPGETRGATLLVCAPSREAALAAARRQWNGGFSRPEGPNGEEIFE
jgi:hypothetical protein